MNKRNFFKAALMTAALLTSGSVLAAQEMNLAITPSLESHYGDGAKAFAAKIADLSGGKFKVNIKPAGALGGERDVLEGMQIGSVEIAITSTGPIGNFVPEIYALDFPFLFTSYDHAHRVLDGPIGQDLLKKFQPKDLIGLAWAENGFRHVTNSKHPVNSPGDLKGLKLRTMENKVHIAAFKAAGASPTPMSWTEVITSLQQGTVDGQENPIPVLTSNKLWEVQKHVTLTGHVYSPAAVVMSKYVWDGLSSKEKNWFKQAAKAAGDATRATVAMNEKNGVALLRKNGMKVITDVDKSSFQKAVQPAYDQYAKEYGESLINKIRASK